MDKKTAQELAEKAGFTWLTTKDYGDELTRLACLVEQKLCSWQPIETAPRDGVILLGYAPHRRMDGTRRVYEGRWNDEQQRFTSVNGFLIHDSATHWMPLPDPPSACKIQVQDSQ